MQELLVLTSTQVADRILDIFQGFRMPELPNVDQYAIVGRDILRQRLVEFIDKQQVIDFVMLGYPMKSPNERDKVIGRLPDLGEKVSIDNFDNFARQVRDVYPPGVNINIVSDGYVFSDVLSISDLTVAGYEEVMRDLVKGIDITFYNATDFYPKRICMRGVRNKILNNFGINGNVLQDRILNDVDTNMLYRGMIKFMEVDLAIRPYSSTNQLHKEAKRVAREMMFRNEAYSNMVNNEFQNSIRISMHPTINNGKKYSFQLIPSEKAWTSPWHSALFVDENGQYETVHRKQAVERGLQLVYENGRPYYFTQN